MRSSASCETRAAPSSARLNAPGSALATCAELAADDWRAIVMRGGSTRPCTRLLMADRCKPPKQGRPLRTLYEQLWRVEVVEVASRWTLGRREVRAVAPFGGVLAGVEFFGSNADTLVWQLTIADVPQLELIAGMPVSARELQKSIDCSAQHPTRKTFDAGTVVSFEIEGRCRSVMFAFRGVKQRV